MGPNSLPKALDTQNPDLGRYSACRRVTRTIYLGSAPTLKGANRGIEDRRIKLGCVQPGESVATFGDALRRLTDQATYLYVDGNRYWVSTQPNVTRTAQDRSEQILLEQHPVWDEIVRRLQQHSRRREDFGAIHVAPESSADIADEPNLGVRLIVLNPQYPHSRKVEDSPARQWVEEVLNQRGASPRYYKNTLVFLAPDKGKLEALEKATAQYLAWTSIVAERTTLNLDPFQEKQAKTKCDNSDSSVENLLREVYQWILVPTQVPQDSIEWTEIRSQGQDMLITRACQKLIHEEHLITLYSPNRLTMEALGEYLWRDADHIDLKRLWEYLAQYLYLPRLKSSQVLLDAIQSGVSNLLWQENFAYADGWDQAKQRYQGLKAGQSITPTLSSHSLLVKPDVAKRQLDADEEARRRKESQSSGHTENPVSPQPAGTHQPGETTTVTPPCPQPPRESNNPKRFFGSVELDPVRCKRDFDQVTEAVLQHLISYAGTEITIRIEVEARAADGFSENVRRTVTENCNTLKFETNEFEEQ